MTLTFELVQDMMTIMCAPNFRSVGPTVQPEDCKQTHRQMDATENITSSANAGGKKSTYPTLIILGLYPVSLTH